MPVPPDGLWGDHGEAPDARWRANGQNQEGARELRNAAVKRSRTRAAYAWAHIPPLRQIAREILKRDRLCFAEQARTHFAERRRTEMS